MKSKPSKSDGLKSKKPQVEKRAGGENSGSTLSAKLREKKDAEAYKKGGCVGIQKKTAHGSILHYIYKHTLGQSVHTQMRQVRSAAAQLKYKLSPVEKILLAPLFIMYATTSFEEYICVGIGKVAEYTVNCQSRVFFFFFFNFQCLQEPFVRSLSSYHYHASNLPFDRRVTCLEWHPTNPSTLVVGSKGGDIELWDYKLRDQKMFIRGMGAGDSVTDMRFNPLKPTQLFTSSMGGTTSLRDFNGTTLTVFACTDTFNFWYCCVDVSISRQMLVTGDNVGNLLLLGLDGQKIFSDKLHKAKVTHAEFNPRCDWLLATASVDHTVKLWDLRNMKDKKSFLHDMPHEKAINSAYFHPSDCSKLLTTDQYNEIRVYSSSDWSKPQQIIRHPHRHFQHITPIKATWHPVYDLIVVGRYPDDRICQDDQRTIDIFDSNTAELVCQLYDPNVGGIKSINKFNPMGDVIGSGMGVTVVVWDQDESLFADDNRPQEETSTSAGRAIRGGRARQQRPTRSRRSGVDQSKLKKKLLSAHQAETTTKTKCTKRTRKQ
ncbi:DNA damage-binding protein 2 isoform X3 [Syngnathus scovelli]|uniref:DNA damage-binding protein 2 isoform X3 n=1 Tax=Syngnathus scovelli TaxID=161590 RepID=UPI00210F7E97|nr:DNA damage-binding protein 2 isoform X3 [Syngnathus scovelli]